MSIKTFVVRSSTLNSRWIVKADSVKDAIIETISFLHGRLKKLDKAAEGDIDLELKVSELKDTVTCISGTPVE